MQELLTTEEAAAYLTISTEHLLNLVSRREIDVIKMNSRRFRFRKSALDAFLRRREVLAHASTLSRRSPATPYPLPSLTTTSAGKE